MANTKISQLTALTNPTGNEEFVYALNNANGKVTLDTMKTFVQQDLSNYQEKLVNGINIKTINGNDILGSGNLVIQGGGGGGGGDTIEFTGTAGGTISEGDPVKIGINGKISKVNDMYIFDDDILMGGVTIKDASQSNVGLKTVSVGNEKFVSAFINNSDEICLCLSDRDGNKYPINTGYLSNGAFDICSTKEGYATVIYREKSTQYPKVFAIDATDYNSGISYGTAIELENIVVKGNICIGITKVMDEDSTTFCALWQRNYTDQSATETGVTMYSICSFSTSDLSITVGTPDSFLGTVNQTAHIPFGYLGSGIVGMAFVNSSNNLVLWARQYSSGTFGSGMSETMAELNSGTIATAPQLIGVGNHMCLLKAENMVYICSIRPDVYKLYEFCDVWHGGWYKRYYTVEGGKYVMCANLCRDMDSTYRSMELTKYKVSQSSMVKISSWKHVFTNAQANYPMPQIITYDNPRLSTEVDTDIGIYYIGASQSGIKRAFCYSDGGRCIGIAKESSTLDNTITVITSGIAAGTFTGTGLPVYIGNGVVSETPSEYLIGHTIGTTQFIFEGVKIV